MGADPVLPQSCGARPHSAKRLCAQGASRAQARGVPKWTWRNREECFDLGMPSPLLPSHVINATEVLVTRNPTLSSSSIEKKVNEYDVPFSSKALL